MQIVCMFQLKCIKSIKELDFPNFFINEQLQFCLFMSPVPDNNAFGQTLSPSVSSARYYVCKKLLNNENSNDTQYQFESNARSTGRCHPSVGGYTHISFRQINFANKSTRIKEISPHFLTMEIERIQFVGMVDLSFCAILFIVTPQEFE